MDDAHCNKNGLAIKGRNIYCVNLTFGFGLDAVGLLAVLILASGEYSSAFLIFV